MTADQLAEKVSLAVNAAMCGDWGRAQAKESLAALVYRLKTAEDALEQARTLMLVCATRDMDRHITHRRNGVEQIAECLVCLDGRLAAALRFPDPNHTT